MSNLDEQMKAKVTIAAIDALFVHGLPAMAKLINTLNNKDVITNEDIDKIGEDMKKSSEYFTDG